jgi:hypothetical protein
MAQMCECDKLVRSVARFLAGFRPVHGSIYYFEKHRCRDRVYRFFTSVRGVVGSGQCPFCGKKFVRRAAMVAHIISIHYHDVLHVAGKE